MRDTPMHNVPFLYSEIRNKCDEIEFSMLSDSKVGALLKMLISSKPKANILEIGTGIGLALSWMVDGMDECSKITSIDNDSRLIAIAKGYFTGDRRVEILCEDGEHWIQNYSGEQFDLIFADAWPGKYSDLSATLDLLDVGGFYVVDDMVEQPNWPDGHDIKAKELISRLESRKDFSMIRMDWSTGIIIMSKKSLEVQN